VKRSNDVDGIERNIYYISPAASEKRSNDVDIIEKKIYYKSDDA